MFSGVLGSPSPAATEQGLDFVLLVDVSGSMSPTQGDPHGSDPERLRWDAVKLVLDLLTKDDRILVLPFNENCPAIILGEEYKATIPGILSPKLDRVEEIRPQLDAKLQGFIHTGNPPNATPSEWNGDWGGTAILGALGVASEKIALAKPTKDHKVVVILLTDGQEDSTDEDKKLVKSGAWPGDKRVERFIREKIPVYTFGLGKDADMTFLKDLANRTGGSSRHLDSNLEIVDAFRELVWSLRDCWIAHVDAEHFSAAQGRISSKPLRGVRDIGVMMYEVDKRQEKAGQPRIVFAPDPLPTLIWQGLAGRPEPQAQKRVGKAISSQRPSGYAYYYFDGEGDVFLRSSGTELIVDLGQDQRKAAISSQETREVHGFFIKRGPRFEIRLDGNSFYRHQPIPLSVVLVKPLPGAAESKYKVKATLTCSDAPGVAVQCQLARVSATEFACQDRDRPDRLDLPDLTVANLALSKGPGETENYILQVAVEEGDSSAPQYQYKLPPVDLGIKNIVLLKPVEKLVLNQSTQRRDMVVEAVYPFHGKVPLQVQRKMPSAKGTLLDEKCVQFAYIPRKVSDTEVVLEDGQLTVCMRLNKDNLPPIDDYENGLVELAAGSQAKFLIRMAGAADSPESKSSKYVLPFDVHLQRVGVELGTPRDLNVGAGKPKDVTNVRIVSKAAPAELRPLKVELKRSGDQALAFSEEELWIEPAGLRVDAPRRQTQTIVSLPAALQLVFQPDPKKHPIQESLVGDHRYLLRITGEDIDSAEAECLLKVGPPVIDATADVKPGQTVDLCVCPKSTSSPIAFQLRYHWLPGGNLPFTIEPPSQSIPFRSVEDKSRGPKKYEVFYDGVSPQLNWSETAWNDLKFALQIPDERILPVGRYQGDLEILFRKERFQSLYFNMNVDALQVVYPEITPRVREKFPSLPETPQQVSQVTLHQCFGRSMKVAFGVQSASGIPLDKDKLKVEVIGPRLKNGRGPYLMRSEPLAQQAFFDYLPAPQCGPSDVRQDPKTGRLWIDLHFPPVKNARQSPAMPYFVDVAISYHQDAKYRDPGKTSLKLLVNFFDAGDLLKGTMERPR
jgi:hypothetical protein